MIERVLSAKITTLSKKLPILVLTGPRQSGKTTLLKSLFPGFTYVSLEDPDVRLFAQNDPRGFLATYPPPLFLDEAQHVPHLFSYIQTLSDTMGKPNQFILSGSQNFLLLEKVSQSLAGRAAILNLLPLSQEELIQIHAAPNLENILFKGFYPRIWDKKLAPGDWYPSFIQTYLERDVRQIKEITNLSLFQKFLKLCAGRIGQILNLSSFANDLGITHNTIRSWLSVLEASFIIFLLPPYYGNLGKRLIKSPKLYFYDVGLACSLLGIESAKQILTHPLKGALFENLIIAELQKFHFHRGKIPHSFFFRDKVGHEIDYLIESPEKFLVVEIKAGQTISPDYLTNLLYWQNLVKNKPTLSYVVYAGKESQKRHSINILPWQKATKILK